MKRYEFTIEPQSGFGTPLKGDTLFGQFCWQCLNTPDLLNKPLEDHIADYPETPFAVFSSAFPVLPGTGLGGYALKTPDMPPSRMFSPAPGDSCQEKHQAMKKRKGKRWMPVYRSEGGEIVPLRIGGLAPDDLMTEAELLSAISAAPAETRIRRREAAEEAFCKRVLQAHNTIHRLTNTTGTDAFAPYNMENHFYYPGVRLAIFVLLDEEATDVDRLETALSQIGRLGFGRDASIGMGRFRVVDAREWAIAGGENAEAVYTLAPSVPERSRDAVTDLWFSPFTRFGKHGDWAGASGKPFKKPVIMADEGAVIQTSDSSAIQRGYVGRGVTDVSLTIDKTVVQGYAPCLPATLSAPKGETDNP